MHELHPCPGCGEPVLELRVVEQMYTVEAVDSMIRWRCGAEIALRTPLRDLVSSENDLATLVDRINERVYQEIKEPSVQLACSAVPAEGGSSSELIVPDGIEPVTGWRFFRLGLDNTFASGLLFATTRAQVWKPREALRARCLKAKGGLHHKAPHESCPKPGCGIYAMATREELLSSDLLVGGISDWDQLALGEVKMWGDIIPGDNGYRAEFAYPSKLFLIRDPTTHEVNITTFGEAELDIRKFKAQNEEALERRRAMVEQEYGVPVGYVEVEELQRAARATAGLQKLTIGNVTATGISAAQAGASLSAAIKSVQRTKAFTPEQKRYLVRSLWALRAVAWVQRLKSWLTRLLLLLSGVFLAFATWQVWLHQHYSNGIWFLFASMYCGLKAQDRLHRGLG